MQSQSFLNNLKNLLEKHEFEQVDLVIDTFNPAGFDADDINKTLTLLRKKCQFKNLEKAANIFIARDPHGPTIIRRQLAQALIEQARFDQSISILDALDKETTEDDAEKPEIRGLLGRAYKQLFVNAKKPEYLLQAIKAYKQGWDAQQGDYRWHGINLVALLQRGAKENIPHVDSGQSISIAHRLISEIKALENPKVWDYGTAMEANLALNNREETLKWAAKYVRHPDADAFELGSSLRQLLEIWKIKGDVIIKSLEPVVGYELLHRPGGVLAATFGSVVDKSGLKPVFGDVGAEFDESGFEAVYGNESYVRIQWLKNMFLRLQSVARVCHKNTGEPCGTGFLLKAADFDTDLDDKLLFVTNAHVVSDDPADKAPLIPELAYAEFTELSGRPTINFGKKYFHSGRGDLDTWICEVETSEPLVPLGVSFYHPLLPQPGSKPQRVYVIGHPKGGDLVISMFNNDLISYELPYVHYSSPTEGGSSGSPVLAADLDVIALHHKAVYSKQANEGVLLDQIRDKISYKKKHQEDKSEENKV